VKLATAQASLGDVFQIQDELAQRIVNSLSLPLTTREHRLLKRDLPKNAGPMNTISEPTPVP
jgi:hypothetical protein